MNIGERIKRRREALGMTQDELAKKVGYKSRSSINKIELSRVLPSNKIEKMAAALDTTPAALMGWEDEPDNSYYTNAETARAAQEIFDNEDMRILFDAARDSKPEDLRMAAE